MDNVLEKKCRMEIEGIDRGKNKKEKDRKKWGRVYSYAELEIKKVSDIFQYLLRI